MAGRCFIVGECGSNWWAGNNESDAQRLERALALIDVAAIAGCDSAKFQAFRSDDLYPKDSEHWNTVKPLELPLEWLRPLHMACETRGLEFMCSVFSEEMVDAVDPYVRRHKVASLEITDLSLLRHIASKGKPVIMSTGAATEEQVVAAVRAIRDVSCDVPITLLHCTTAYPCPPEEANLGQIVHLALGFPSCNVGLSDHTLDAVVAPAMSVIAGATVIEKHLTLGRSLKGPDHAYALEPHELKRMVSAVRMAERMLGDGQKRIQPSEEQWVKWQHRDGGVRGA